MRVYEIHNLARLVRCVRARFARPSSNANHSSASRAARGTDAQTVVRRRRKIRWTLGGETIASKGSRPISNDLRPRRLGDAHVRRAEEAEGAVAEAADDRGCVVYKCRAAGPGNGSRKTRVRRGPFGLGAAPRRALPRHDGAPVARAAVKGRAFLVVVECQRTLLRTADDHNDGVRRRITQPGLFEGQFGGGLLGARRQSTRRRRRAEAVQPEGVQRRSSQDAGSGE